MTDSQKNTNNQEVASEQSESLLLNSLEVHSSVIDSLAGVVVLAGGLSTRMGSPKALLELPSGETLLDYHVRCAAKLGKPVLIADNEQGFYPDFDSCSYISSDSHTDISTKLIHIDDYQPQSSNPHAEKKHSAGPLGAILSAMLHLLHSSAPSQWLIVVSCDSLVSAIDIQNKLHQQNKKNNLEHSHPVYCLKDDVRLYPLLGKYQLTLAEKLNSYLDAGERRVMNFITPLCQPVVMPKDWYPLSNLNTPEQFQQACQKL